MSNIMKKMQEVREPGLHKDVVTEGVTRKPLVNNSNSMTNHLRAFADVQGEVGSPTNAQTQQQNTHLTEENSMKMIGGLQVVKELLEGDLTKEPQAILQRVKTILGNF